MKIEIGKWLPLFLILLAVPTAVFHDIKIRSAKTVNVKLVEALSTNLGFIL